MKTAAAAAGEDCFLQTFELKDCVIFKEKCESKIGSSGSSCDDFCVCDRLLVVQEGDFAKGFLLIIVVSCNVHTPIFDCNKAKKNL